jgi:hypothetical protein
VKLDDGDECDYVNIRKEMVPEFFWRELKTRKLKVVGRPVQISNRYLANINLERCRFTSLLSLLRVLL